MTHFHIITLFPDSIRPYLESSILGKAAATDRKSRSEARGRSPKIKVSYYNPKDFVKKSARVQDDRVDRRPYGGGPGMVLRPEPLLRAVEKALGKRKGEVIFFSTDGKQFDEAYAQRLSKKKDIVLICGHYEGVDERVAKIHKARKVSIGPYVLTGGELPAAIVADAVARFIPGVLGKSESLERSRVSSPEVYTRPEVLEWKGRKYRVPKVLLSGHHAEIDTWKMGRTKKKS